MNDPRQQIWPIFVEETREHLQQAGECLLSLEKPEAQRPPGQLKRMMRVLHSMKGGAGSLSFSAVERLAHAMEDALAKLPPEPVLARTLVDALLDGMRLIEGIVRDVEAGIGEREPAELAAVIAALGGKAPTPPPRTEDEQVSHELWPVFRGDVADAMALLGEALRNRTAAPDQPELVRWRELSDTI